MANLIEWIEERLDGETVEVDTQAYADAKALIRQWSETGAHPARRATNLTDAAGRMVWLYRVGATDWHTAAPMCKAVRSDS